jgi:hypothetical protein
MATTRENLMKILEEKYPNLFMRTTEEFDGTKGGIWSSGESGVEATDGKPLFQYYNEDYDEVIYVLGIHKEIGTILEDNGWFPEWHDAGTIMFYEM